MTVLALDALTFSGTGLLRPECVLTHRSGLLFAADWTGHGGVSIVDPATGGVRRLLSRREDVKPNGILLEDGGTFLLTHLAAAEGGVFRLHPNGTLDPVLTEVDGRPLPPSNFALKDPMGRLYVTISTSKVPRHEAAHADARDGFIVMKPPVGRAVIVAEGLGYTNEAILSPDGTQLFVNETFSRETSVFAVRSDGSLGPREQIAHYGKGIYPDGLALDVAGDLWVTSIISNTVLRVAMDGTQTVILADRDEPFVDAVEAQYQAKALDRVLLDRPHLGPLKNISSLAFGGPDMRTAYLGCLLGDSIAQFESPVAGLTLPHYEADITPLAEHGLLPPARAT